MNHPFGCVGGALSPAAHFSLNLIYAIADKQKFTQKLESDGP
jgi:hypothetical protein